MNKNRYQDCKTLSGKRRLEVVAILDSCFSEPGILRAFVQEHFGPTFCQSINWNQAFSSVSYDLANSCGPEGKTGALLEALAARFSENRQIQELIDYLVEAGYLTDKQAPPRRSTNQYNTDWLKRYPTDYCVVQEAAREFLLEALESSFTSVAAVEAFLLDNFPDNFGQLQAHCIDRKQTVRAVLESTLAAFESVRRMTAFVLAVQDCHQTEQNDKMGFAAMMVLSHSAGAVPVASAASTAAQPKSSEAAALPATPKSTSLKVLSLSADLNHELQIELRKLLVAAFSSRFGLEELVRQSLKQHLEHIVCADASLNKIGEDLIRWCVENVQLPSLLNGMLEARPTRTELKAFVRKLAQAGILTLEE